MPQHGIITFDFVGGGWVGEEQREGGGGGLAPLPGAGGQGGGNGQGLSFTLAQTVRLKPQTPNPKP